MKNKPDISDEEIQSFMDFDTLLNKQTTQARQKLMAKSAVILIIALSLIALLIWLPNAESVNNTDQTNQTIPSSLNQEHKRLDTLTITPAQNSSDISQDTISSLKPNRQKAVGTPGSPEKTKKMGLKTPVQKENNTQTKEYHSTEYLYSQAEPIVGYPALYEYFRQELTYPISALADSVQGVVTVFFTIKEDGMVSKIRIENSLGPAFDNEVVRLINGMPKWKPATVNGKPVASTMSLPFTFQYETLPASK